MVQNNTNRRQYYRQRPALGRNLQLPNAACSYCGFHHEGRGCTAYGKDCRSCGKKNHFASMCRTGNKQVDQQNKRGMIPRENRRNVRKTVENNLSEDSDQYDCSDEDDYFEGSIKHIVKIGKVKAVSRQSDTQKTVKIHLGDVEMKVEPDSGADVNLMDEFNFTNLRKLSGNKLKLEKSKVELSTLQSFLSVKGEFRTVVRNATCGIETKFIVIKGKINSLPLLSKATLLELGMMQIRPDGSFAKPNDLRVTNKSMKLDVNQVTEKRKTEMTEILDEFGSVFEGIGKIRDNKNDNELYVKVNMKPGIAPVSQKPRQVRTKLGYIQRKHNDREITEEKEINKRDKCYKEKFKHKAENRNTRKYDFKIGDYVLLERNKRDKWSTAYEPAFYNTFVINGSTVGARRVSDGREIHRDASKFKLANALVQDEDYGPPARQAREGADWREDLLRTEYKQTRNCVQNQGLCDNRQTLNDRSRREHRMPPHLNDYVM
jgi:hypothetical protein